MIQLHNFKITAYFTKDSISRFCSINHELLSKNRNYYIFGVKPGIITTFYTNGSVNITNIKSLDSIQPYLKTLHGLLGLDSSSNNNNNNNIEGEQIYTYRIDNITATTSFREGEERLNLTFFCEFCITSANANIIKISYNNLNFPNAFLKTIFGTVIISSRLKCTFIGFKSVNKINYINNVLTTLVHNYLSKVKRGTY